MQISAEEWERCASFAPNMIKQEHIPDILTALNSDQSDNKYYHIFHVLDNLGVRDAELIKRQYMFRNRFAQHGGRFFPIMVSKMTIKKMRIPNLANYSLKARLIYARLYHFQVDWDVCEQIRDHYLASIDELVDVYETTAGRILWGIYTASPINYHPPQLYQIYQHLPLNRRYQFHRDCLLNSSAIFTCYNDIPDIQEYLTEWFSTVEPGAFGLATVDYDRIGTFSPTLSRFVLEHRHYPIYIQYCQLPRPLTYDETMIMKFFEQDDPIKAKEAIRDLDVRKYRLVPHNVGQTIALLPQSPIYYNSAIHGGPLFIAADILYLYHLLIMVGDGYLTYDQHHGSDATSIIYRLPSEWFGRFAEAWGSLNNMKLRITRDKYELFLRQRRDMAFFFAKK